MREPFKDLVLTLRVWRDDEATEAERFKAGFDEYPSACGTGRTAEAAFREFGWILSPYSTHEPVTVKNLKRAQRRHEAKQVRKSIRRQKGTGDSA